MTVQVRRGWSSTIVAVTGYLCIHPWSPYVASDVHPAICSYGAGVAVSFHLEAWVKANAIAKESRRRRW